MSAARGGEAVAGTHLVPVSLRLVIIMMIMMILMMIMVMMMIVKQNTNLVINSSKDQDVQYEQRGANGNGDTQGGGIGGQASLNIKNSYLGAIKSRKKICI